MPPTLSLIQRINLLDSLCHLNLPIKKSLKVCSTYKYQVNLANSNLYKQQLILAVCPEEKVTTIKMIAKIIKNKNTIHLFI